MFFSKSSLSSSHSSKYLSAVPLGCVWSLLRRKVPIPLHTNASQGFNFLGSDQVGPTKSLERRCLRDAKFDESILWIKFRLAQNIT